MNCLALALGAVSVLQAGLNRKVAQHLGIASATVLNNSVLLVASLVLWFLARSQNATALSWRVPCFLYFAPGLLGLILVAGIPSAIGRFGALAVFTPLITAQILSSLAWDGWIEGMALSTPRMIGAAMTLLGTILISLA